MREKFLICILLLVAFSAQAASAGPLQDMTYTITATGGSDEYRIEIAISNITAGGLSIEFPGAFEITDTSIPAGHYGSEGDTFIAALTGETEIYIDVICPDLATGEILAYWEDLAKGTHGGEELSVQEPEEEQKTGGTSAKETPFGYSGILVILSAAVAGFIARTSNKDFFREED